MNSGSMSILEKLKNMRGILYKKYIEKKKVSIERNTRASQMIAILRKEPKERVVIQEKKKKVKESKFPKFTILPSKPLVSFHQPTKSVDIKYSLIRPYAYAVIRWDIKEDALVYHVIEPPLSDEEKDILNKLKQGLIESIDVSFEAVKKGETSLEFLEEHVQNLIDEYDFDITKDQYMKIMYYIYRDFVGLNEIEPFLHDPFVEDISCDGVKIPLYVVHQKLGSLQTNVQFDNEVNLRNMVVKLAERCDRYISYAEPLLDGTLPDGSRVQASIAGDITTKGPTFTIRKFRDVPFTPVDMVELGTASPEMLAYLWFVVEQGRNILICGGVSTGKTSFLNNLSLFIPPHAKIVSIEDSVLGNSEILYRRNGNICKSTISELIDPYIGNKEKIKNKDIEIFGLDNNGKIKLFKPSAFIRHKVKKTVIDIKLASGRSISVTADHSLFSINEEGKIVPVAGHNLKIGSFIATPRILPYTGKSVIFDLSNDLDKLDCFVEGPTIKDFINKNRSKIREFLTESGIKWCEKKGIIKSKLFKKFGGKLNEKTFLRSRYGTILPSKIEIDDDLATFVGLWLADGSYDKNSIIVSVVDEESREIVRKIASKYNINYKMHSDGISLLLNSKLFKQFFENVLNLRGNAYTKRLPDWVFNLPESQLAALLRGYFSGDGWIRKNDVAIRSSSLGLLKDIQTALLRFEVQFRFSHKKLKDNTYEARISGRSLNNFLKIGFLQQNKMGKLMKLQNRDFHDVSDIIPLPKHFYKTIKPFLKKSGKYTYKSWKSWDRKYVGKQNADIGRSTLQEIIKYVPNNPHNTLHNLALNDVFWDKIIEIKKREYQGYVYDISVPGAENFICENIIAHNTRELNLPHENWIPAVARAGFGGTKIGEVDMFELLRESFRQNPDYLIVGEVRGKEASVMFQGLASGHPGISTIHAGSVDDVIKRLETPPINLSPGLLETLDLIIVMVHAKEKGKSARRVKKVVELLSIDKNGKAETLDVFTWNPATDKFEFHKSKLLEDISAEKGLSMENIKKDIEIRKKIIEWMVKNRPKSWQEIAKYIAMFQTEREKLLEIVGMKEIITAQ